MEKELSRLRKMKSLFEIIDYIMILLLAVFAYWLMETPAWIRYVYVPDMSNAFEFVISEMPIEQQGGHIIRKNWRSMKYRTDRRQI